MSILTCKNFPLGVRHAELADFRSTAKGLPDLLPYAALSGVFEAYGWICPQRNSFFLAAKAIFQPPPFSAAGGNFKIQTSAEPLDPLRVQLWRSSSAPFRFPAWLKGWQWYPPAIRSTAGRQAGSRSRMSPQRETRGQCCSRILLQYSSISICPLQVIPAHSRLREKPPIPAQRSRNVTTFPAMRRAP